MADKKKPKAQKAEKPEEKVLEVNITKAQELDEETRKQEATKAITEERANTDIQPSKPPEQVPGLPEYDQAKAPEKYHWVIFSERTTPTDDVDVTLTVNGECLIVKRGTRVPLPDRFLECADHTRHPRYSQNPGDTRKVVTWIKTFSYERIGDAAEEDFIEFRRKGTLETRERIERESTTEG